MNMLAASPSIVYVIVVLCHFFFVTVTKVTMLDVAFCTFVSLLFLLIPLFMVYRYQSLLKQSRDTNRNNLDHFVAGPGALVFRSFLPPAFLHVIYVLVLLYLYVEPLSLLSRSCFDFCILFPCIILLFLLTLKLDVPLSTAVSIVGAIMVAFTAFICFLSDVHPFVNYLNNTLGQIPVVELPQHYIHTEIDDYLTRMIPLKINTLVGSSGCGKSVALYRYLNNQSVVWLSGRDSLCVSLQNMKFHKRSNKVDEDNCYSTVFNALSTHKFPLVIDDAQAIASDSPLISLFRGYGSRSFLPFPIYFTVSDYYDYDRIHILLTRVDVINWFNYPNETMIELLASKLNLNYTWVMRDVGPSLRLINEYATHGAAAISLECNTVLASLNTFLKKNNDTIPFLENMTASINSDYEGYSGSSDDYVRFLEHNLVTVLFDNTLGFHNPLIRRAACSYFAKQGRVIDSCMSVSTCSQLGNS
ncbi:hypothetical protein RCL1_002602 [Eukaryota sp. TZLM3-RCL]